MCLPSLPIYLLSHVFTLIWTRDIFTTLIVKIQYYFCFLALGSGNIFRYILSGIYRNIDQVYILYQVAGIFLIFMRSSLISGIH